MIHDYLMGKLSVESFSLNALMNENYDPASSMI